MSNSGKSKNFSLKKKIDPYPVLQKLRPLLSDDCYHKAWNVILSKPDESKEDFLTFLESLVGVLQQKLQTPGVKPLKVFLVITGETHGAHQQLLDQLNAQGSRVMPMDNVQQCDAILLFCPILSRVRSDVEAAFRKIPDGPQGKSVILVLMHHTRKPDYIFNQTRWSEEFSCINQEVHVLYHVTKNGLLQCPRNQEAVQILQSICDSYMLKNKLDELGSQSTRDEQEKSRQQVQTEDENDMPDMNSYVWNY